MPAPFIELPVRASPHPVAAVRFAQPLADFPA